MRISNVLRHFRWTDGQATNDCEAGDYKHANGNREAVFQLAERFEVGNGVPSDLEIAVRLYQRAANPVGGASNPVFSSNGELVQGATNSGFYVSGLPEANSRAAKLQQILDLARIARATDLLTSILLL
ncbi:MAG: SEL1-like repeat protein [Rhodospirillales bacterium]|nr:SEL1-like repeat protein [Rhodospirillales bacterium]